MPLSDRELAALKARVAQLRAEKERAAAASSRGGKENATRASRGAMLPPGAKSIDRIVEELNALGDDPRDVTAYWVAHYREIKAAMARERYHEALAAHAEGRQIP